MINYVYKNIAIIVIILGFVLGLIIGGFTKDQIDGINIQNMIITWGTTLAISFPIFATHSICSRLDMIINNQKDTKN